MIKIILAFSMGMYYTYNMTENGSSQHEQGLIMLKRKNNRSVTRISRLAILAQPFCVRLVIAPVFIWCYYV